VRVPPSEIYGTRPLSARACSPVSLPPHHHHSCERCLSGVCRSRCRIGMSASALSSAAAAATATATITTAPDKGKQRQAGVGDELTGDKTANALLTGAADMDNGDDGPPPPPPPPRAPLTAAVPFPGGGGGCHDGCGPPLPAAATTPQESPPAVMMAADDVAGCGGFKETGEMATKLMRDIMATTMGSEGGRMFGTAVDIFNRNFEDLWNYLLQWAQRLRGPTAAGGCGSGADQRARDALLIRIEEAHKQACALVSVPQTRAVPIGAYIEAKNSLPDDMKALWVEWLKHYDPKLMQQLAPRFAYTGLAVINDCWTLVHPQTGKELLRPRSKARIMGFFTTLDECANVCRAVGAGHLHGSDSSGAPGGPGGGEFSAMFERAMAEAEKAMPTTAEGAIDLIKHHIANPASQQFVHLALRQVHGLGFDLNDLPAELNPKALMAAAGIRDDPNEDSLNADVRRRRAELQQLIEAHALKHRSRGSDDGKRRRGVGGAADSSSSSSSRQQPKKDPDTAAAPATSSPPTGRPPPS